MGKVEDGVRIRIRKSKINKAIIGSLAVAGVLTVAVIAPGLPGALSKLLPRQKQTVRRSLSRLIAAGFITLEGDSGAKRARLTPKGERFAALLGEGRLTPKKPRRWDGKWRMLIFDVPETRRRSRQQIRATLQQLGFLRLQDSVWVYPYDCEDLITLFKTDFRLGKDLLYVVADAIEYDKPLRLHFGLTNS